MTTALVAAIKLARENAKQLRAAMTEVRRLTPEGVRIVITPGLAGGIVEAQFDATVPLDRDIYEAADSVCRLYPSPQLGGIGHRVRILKSSSGTEKPDIFPVKS